MKQNLRVSLGAVVLALATLVAVIYAWINFRQREIYDIPDDGVAWLDTTTGAQAWKVTPNSPAARAGVRAEDVLVAIDDYAGAQPGSGHEAAVSRGALDAGSLQAGAQWARV